MKRILLLAVISLAFIFSCSTDRPQHKRSLEVENDLICFDASGNSPVFIQVTAVGVEWRCEAAESVGWIIVSERDEETLCISVADNTDANERRGSVKVAAVGGEAIIREITVVQKGVDNEGVRSLSVDPASLTFVCEKAPAQEVEVITGGKGLGWSVQIEDGCEWIHTEVHENRVKVTVDDNPKTASRASNLIVVPQDSSVAKKAVRVTQEGKVLPPSVTVSPAELNFEYMPAFGQTVMVEAVNVDWNARTSDTPDITGKEVAWLELQVFRKDGTSSVLVTPGTNTTLESRSGYVVIVPDNPQVKEVCIPVTQEAGREFLTNLTDDV